MALLEGQRSALPRALVAETALVKIRVMIKQTARPWRLPLTWVLTASLCLQDR